MAETPVVSDLFNRADESPLGSPWITQIGSGCKVVSNQATVVLAGNAGALYNSGTLANDQYVKVSSVSGTYAGLLIRSAYSTYNRTGYIVWFPGAGGAGGQAYRYSGSGPSFVSLGNFSTSQGPHGKVMKLTMIGTALKGYIDTTQECSFTDATYASGRGGIAPYGATCDNFIAGDITADSAFKAAWVPRGSRVIGGNA